MMNSKKLITLAGALLAALISTACLSSSQVAPDQADNAPMNPARFDQVCNTDIEAHCADVLPGDGRISACLYAHTDLLEDSCYDATEKVGIILEGVFDGIESFYAVCSVDMSEFCEDAPVGGGGVIACLMKNLDKLSAGCAALVPGM